MDLSRKDYPAMLDSLQPGQAVTVLQDRVKHITKLNSDIADWLAERRRIEEQYVHGLRKLARRQPPDESTDLGVFSTPWQKIINSAEALAESHHTLAQKIETDVERPLREFATADRDMQSISTISGNLASMAKEIESAQKKTGKLKDKGARASAAKVAHATSEVENATQTWDSQAPYVFEKLQAIDESRLNHLRDVLTQFQTHEVDQVERNRVTAEQCLNVLLNVETTDEIKTFAAKTVSGKSKVERQRSRNAPSSSLAPTTPPTANADDGSSQRSSSIQEQPHTGILSLRRFGTVFKGRRQSGHPYPRGASPERRSSSNLFGHRAGRSKDTHAPVSPRPSTSPARQLSEGRIQSPPRLSESSVSPKQSPTSADKVNGTSTDSQQEPVTSSSLLNGTQSSSIPQLQEPLQPTSSPATSIEPPKDAEGFSVPPSTVDAITQAEQEANSINETPQPQFKVDIRNAPIQEEEGDAETAFTNVANMLKEQAAPARKTGTVRGRRDVRNTVYLSNPPPPPPSDLSAGESSYPGSSPSPVNISIPSSPPAASPHSPFKPGHRHAFLGDDHTTSDTQSVRSGRSLASAASYIKHPDMHEPGLNSSIVETVSASFNQGNILRSVLIGEVALAYNPIDLSAPFGTESIRLENFPVLDKVAPNPVFIEQLPDQPGTYTVNLASITKVNVAFKYQVHLDDAKLATHTPVLITPFWRVEPTQTSVIVNYSLHPDFVLGSHTSVTMNNLIIIIHLQSGTKTGHCQSKPVGNFSRERSVLYWRLGNVTFAPDQEAQQLRARFFTETEGKAGNVEARWSIEGENAAGFGSKLTVSLMQSSSEGAVPAPAEGADPFADEGSSPSPSPTMTWKEVPTLRMIQSGSYTAV